MLMTSHWSLPILHFKFPKFFIYLSPVIFLHSHMHLNYHELSRVLVISPLGALKG